jgi:L-alanine-DL-glutamate epimerase-like enolase superfamily enzyme
MTRHCARAGYRGVSILKIKLSTPRDARHRAIVREEAPHATLRVDANAAWTAKRALMMLEPLTLRYDM